MLSSTLIITKENETTARRTFKDTLKRLKSVITVEPLVACYQMALGLAKPALDNLEFEKSCRVNLAYNTTICDAILASHHENFSLENDKIQTDISTMHSWQQPVQSFTPLVLILFLGSFSDRHKLRKPFLLMPVVGELFGVAGCILCVMFMYHLPLEVQGISQKIIPSLFGGQTMLVMATTAYIADVSSIEMRTLRLGVVQIVIGVVLPLVQSFSGILFVKCGYISVFSISFALQLIGLLYGLFWIKESQKDSTKCEQKLLSDMFNPKHARDTFNLILNKNSDNDRVLIWYLVLMSFFHRSAFDGETSVLYLYTQNVFHWTPLEFSYFLTVNSIVALAGHLFGVPFFTKVLKYSDFTILFLTTIDKMVTNLCFGLAKTITVFYIGVAVSIVTKIYRTAKKSLATKIVSKDDIGKTQSLLGIFDVLAPAASVPIYNRVIYINTLEIFPAAIFFFSIILYVFCCIFIMLMYWRVNSKQTPESSKEANPETYTNKNVVETIHL